jgi:CubicO group peptidase (beta-lactamase class C family)
MRGANPRAGANRAEPPNGVTVDVLAREFEPVVDQLADFWHRDPSYSAQLAVVWRGETVVDATVGSALHPDSLCLAYSSSKGIAGLCVARLVQSGEIALDRTMANYWPEFAAAGKREITVRTALSHRAGVIGVSGGFSLAELLQPREFAARLASAPPMWLPGAAHGYHAATLGTMIEELVARVSGVSFQDFYRREIRDALDADFHFGVPSRARLRIVEPAFPEELIADAAPDPFSFPGVALGNGRLELPFRSGDLASLATVGFAAFGGFGNARSLAKVYAAALDGGPFAGSAVQTMSRLHSLGHDLVIATDTRFGLIFQLSHSRLDFGSPWSFGHDGYGGSLAYADPAFEVAFGYVPGTIPTPPAADPKALALSTSVRDCVTAIRRRATRYGVAS